MYTPTKKHTCIYTSHQVCTEKSAVVLCRYAAIAFSLQK